LTRDIGPALAGWDFDPDNLQVRLIEGRDGRDKIQMRVDLGVLQMECEGRPDGQRPSGHESLLEASEARLREARDADGEFTLEPEECAALLREGVQYYHRYLAAFHLQMYDLVVRDTERNLRLFAFVVRHATRNRDKIQFDQYRPYVTMMRTRALALERLAVDDHAAALDRIDEGIELIRKFLAEYEQQGEETECSELAFLLRWRREIQRERPAGPIERLEEQLEMAVDMEAYEEAARIRDQIRKLKRTNPRETPAKG